MKVLKAFIKPFGAPQRSVKINIEVDFYFDINFLKERLSRELIICDVLRNLVPFVQFKKCEKPPWMSVKK